MTIKDHTVSYYVENTSDDSHKEGSEKYKLRKVTRKVMTLKGAYLFDNERCGRKLVLTEERQFMWRTSETIHERHPTAGFAYQGNPGEGAHLPS